jgi:hypothetical protein
MGFIIDDHDQGIHGELRRESFTVFSDFGNEFSVELPIGKLDEMIFVLHELRRIRNEGKQYPEHHRFLWTSKENEKDCPVCEYIHNGTGPDHATSCARKNIEQSKLEGQHLAVGRMKAWAETTWPHLRDEIVKMCDDLMASMEKEIFLSKWTSSKVQKEFENIQIESYLKAAAEICEGCNRGGEHACRAVPIRALAARLNPDLIHVSPRDWTPIK